MKSGDLYITTGMCLEKPGEEQGYFQVSGSSSSKKFQEVYWKCAVVFFASSVRHNPQAKHLLFTNADAVPNIGNLNTEAFLDRIGVQVVTIPFTFCPPLDYHSNYRTTFFKFDILKYLNEHIQPEDKYSSFDSDCIWIRSADRLAQSIDRFGIINYHLDYLRTEQVHDFNCCTKEQMHEIYVAMGFPLDEEVPKHFGAELIAGNGKELRTFFKELREVWSTSMMLYTLQQPKFNYEEYMLSFLYNKLGIQSGTANLWLKRIWTTPIFRNSGVENFNLDIWHLPSEKQHGFKRLFQQAIDFDSQFWNVEPGEKFARYIGGYVGVPHPSLMKKTADFLDMRVHGLRKRLALN
jgi:hypothetical protein